MRHILAVMNGSGEQPRASAYHWTLRQPLQTITIPPAEGDADLPLGLRTVFGTVYDRAGCDYALDYASTIEPPLAEADRLWPNEVLRFRTTS